MADDEQFSLCWNNFNSNLSAGFHESLCRGDLVDVTLAAEGQFVKAHRLVLSVCSPYFRKMFTQMPANQHAFVFLKDVSHTALKDLIQFMYCGEVNVKQEALPAFISTAEALQIKGLTDSDPPQSQTPPEPSTPTPPQIQQIATSPRVRQRTSTSRSYKIETVDDSGEEQKQQPTQIVIQTTAAPPQATIVHHAPQQQQQQHHIQTAQATQQQQQIVTAAPTTTTTTVLTQKRPAQRSIGSSAPHIKRTKSTIETIVDTSNEAAQQNVQVQQQPQQITVQAAVVTTDKSGHQQAETEYIDLPIDLPTKSEPEYADEAGDVEGDHEGTYVEDDAYADIRYDESYFTENEDGGNNVSSGTTTVSTGGGNSTATTSKAVIKQQQSSFSDSTYVDGGAGDQGNNDAQAKKAVKRGRPRKIKGPVMKPRDKLLAAIENNDGKPAVYASTIKGSMKLYYDGHHFNYFFRKGQHSIFQCCYKESKQQCPVKVVCDQKLVYPLEGEHIHFMKATDKSVTSVKFECAEFVSLLIDNNEPGLIANATKAAEENANNTKIEPIDAGDDIGQEVVIEMEEDEGAKSVEVVREALEEAEIAAAEDNEEEEFLRDDDASDVGGVEHFQDEVAASAGSTKTEAKDFREQIKKRLQSALLRKMK